jgi:hypothetical protein
MASRAGGCPDPEAAEFSEKRIHMRIWATGLLWFEIHCYAKGELMSAAQCHYYQLDDKPRRPNLVHRLRPSFRKQLA